MILNFDRRLPETIVCSNCGRSTTVYSVLAVADLPDGNLRAVDGVCLACAVRECKVAAEDIKITVAQGCKCGDCGCKVEQDE